MKLPTQLSGLGTTGLTGVVLMTLHLTDYLTGWWWAILYVLLILSGIGQENRKIK